MRRAIHGRVALSIEPISFCDKWQGADIEWYEPIELVLGPADCSCISCSGEPPRLTMVLNVMSDSPVADGYGGISTLFSSSSESSITLRFVISGNSQIATNCGHALFDESNVMVASRWSVKVAVCVIIIGTAAWTIKQT